MMEEWSDEFNIPALAVLVFSHNSIIDKAIIGVTNAGESRRATFDDYFHLGSNTKAVTAFIAAKLVEEGTLNWDTAFFELFPEHKAGSRPEYSDITLADLLSHRAGIRAYLSGKEISRLPEMTGDIRDRRAQFSQLVLREKPQKVSKLSLFTEYTYSNAGYVLAAAMLERATGQSWEDLVRRVLVSDLNLSVHVGWPVEIGEDQPRGHLPGSYMGKSTDELMVYDKNYIYQNQDIFNPAGHLSVRILDYARFIQMHLAGLQGKSNYLSSHMYEYMHFGVKQYSLGWANSTKDGQLVSSHEGSAGNFYCRTQILKEKDIAVVIFANSGIINTLKLYQSLRGERKLKRYLSRIVAIYEA